MARNRIVKPQFWTDEMTGTLSDKAKLLFIGMLNFADDEGKIIGNLYYLNSMIFPYAQEIEHIQKSLIELSEKNLIFAYKIKNQDYYWIVNFRKHQKIDKPQPSQIPNPKTSDKKFRKLLFDKSDGICPVCGERLVFEGDGANAGAGSSDMDRTAKSTGPESRALAIDHIISKDNGGSDAPHNLKAICMACNLKMGGKADFEAADRSENGRRMVDEPSGTNENEKEKEKENDNENENENKNENENVNGDANDRGNGSNAEQHKGALDPDAELFAKAIAISRENLVLTSERRMVMRDIRHNVNAGADKFLRAVKNMMKSNWPNKTVTYFTDKKFDAINRIDHFANSPPKGNGFDKSQPLAPLKPITTDTQKRVNYDTST